MILLIPVSLDSKQILKQLSMISHTLSLVSMVPSGDSTSVRRTCSKYTEQTYKFQHFNDDYLLNERSLLSGMLHRSRGLRTNFKERTKTRMRKNKALQNRHDKLSIGLVIRHLFAKKVCR
jgi:hypothetical protein